MQFPVVGYISPTHPLTYSKQKFGKFRQGVTGEYVEFLRFFEVFSKFGVP